MGEVLVGIQPQELSFIFELKKQSSCSVHLTNKSDEYVAFKVKTTSPKRYCVRPNTGVILPRSTCDFTVTMQAQKEAPPDMQLKDKFLIQSTIVPIGTTEEDIVSSTFSKESTRYIQENKLRVVLVSPSHSPASELLKETEKFEQNSTVPIILDISKTKDDNFKQEIENNAVAMETVYNFAKQEITHNDMLSEPNTDAWKLEPSKEVAELENIHFNNNGDNKDDPVYEHPLPKSSAPSTVEVFNRVDDFAPSHADEDVNVLISRLNELEMKLEKAHNIIAKLSEDGKVADKQRDKLLQDIALLRRKPIARGQVGFPFLFVVFVAFVGLIGGRLLHS